MVEGREKTSKSWTSGITNGRIAKYVGEKRGLVGEDNKGLACGTRRRKEKQQSARPKVEGKSKTRGRERGEVEVLSR